MSSVLNFIYSVEKVKIKGFSGICFKTKFNTDKLKVNNGSLPFIDYPNNFNKFTPNRQAEFITGRYLARKALLELGSPETIVPVGKNRAPRWPTGFVGSISHTNDIVYCAVARLRSLDVLGIDIERLFDEKTTNGISDSIVKKQEMDMIINLRMPLTWALTVVFSAKESLFKALYPRLGVYFDFLDVDIVNINEEDKTFTIKIKNILSKKLGDRSEYIGRYSFLDQEVMTILYS